jgi:hypothetical protein
LCGSTWLDPGAFLAVSHGKLGGGAELSWSCYPSGNHDNSFIGWGLVGRVYGIATPAFAGQLGVEGTFYPLGLELGWSARTSSTGPALTGPYIAPYVSLLGVVYVTAQIVVPTSGAAAEVTWFVGIKYPMHRSGSMPEVLGSWAMDE